MASTATPSGSGNDVNESNETDINNLLDFNDDFDGGDPNDGDPALETDHRGVQNDIENMLGQMDVDERSAADLMKAKKEEEAIRQMREDLAKGRILTRGYLHQADVANTVTFTFCFR